MHSEVMQECIQEFSKQLKKEFGEFRILKPVFSQPF